MRDPSTWLLMWTVTCLQCSSVALGWWAPLCLPCVQLVGQTGAERHRHRSVSTVNASVFGCVARQYARQLRRHGVFTKHCSCRISCCDLHHFTQK